jgi:3-carboxy-cis,cis-muconate cycloisomerase
MPASPLDSAIYRELFGDAEIARLFADTAEIRAMLLVEGALAEVQGELGLIPEAAAKAIHRAALDVQIDPAALAAETGRNAVPVPALVAAFRAAMHAPEHAQYVHWGATSQDIMDTGLLLRLRKVLELLELRIGTALEALATQAETYAETPMAARTYGQAATPTSFGAVAAGWGRPLLGLREDLAALRPRLLVVSLGGAAGTLSVMGEKAPEVRARLAERLGLGDPGASWHADRDRIAALSAWLTRLAGAAGKMGEDLTLMAQSGLDEVDIGAGGGSSTMPQKANPVLPALLAALAREVAGLNTVMQGALLHRQGRDGAAWFTEWLTLPQMCLLAGRAVTVAGDLAATLRPRPERMAALLDDGTGVIFAEALTFALSGRMPRPKAQEAVKALCQEALATGAHLRTLAERDHPGDWGAVFDPARQLGTAPAEARAFATRVRTA